MDKPSFEKDETSSRAQRQANEDLDEATVISKPRREAMKNLKDGKGEKARGQASVQGRLVEAATLGATSPVRQLTAGCS